MKTKVQPTSIEAYYELKNLGARQLQVYRLLEQGPMSNMDLSKRLGIPINRVTGRTKELRDLGLVEAKGKKPCPYTSRPVIIWGVVDSCRKKPVNLELFHHMGQ